MNKGEHIPVLLSEALSALHVNKTRKYIDATLGAGGHAVAILERGGKVLAIEADREMIIIARPRLEKTGGDFEIVWGNFVNVDRIAEQHGYSSVDGVIYDLGISSFHYKSGRGFSFEKPEEPLDMRLDVEAQAVTAADLLNSLRGGQMEALLAAGMSAGEARKTAKRLEEYGRSQKYETVGDLLRALEGRPRGGKLHPATKVFAALRIAVNTELTNLAESLPRALRVLRSGGVMVVISFHSGEDKIVKRLFGEWELSGAGKRLTKKPVLPGEDEVARNPRARSARMRVLQKK